MSYKLRCVAPDGAFVTEGEFETVEAAWKRASDMGSRWFFYPICIVTGAGQNARIVDLPDTFLPVDWRGKTLKRLCETLSGMEAEVCECLNNGWPLLHVYP